MIDRLFSLVFHVVFFLALVTAAVAGPAPAPAPPAVAPAPPPALKPGTRATLQLDGQQVVWLARSEPDYFAMLAAEKTLYDQRPNRPAGGGAAIFRLAQAKRVTAFAVGTRVRVVADHGTALVVEVTAGDDKGARGWVQREMVRVGK